MVLQGRAGYTTGSQAEMGAGWEALLWFPAAQGADPDPRAGRMPSAIPWHPAEFPLNPREGSLCLEQPLLCCLCSAALGGVGVRCGG